MNYSHTLENCFVTPPTPTEDHNNNIENSIKESLSGGTQPVRVSFGEYDQVQFIEDADSYNSVNTLSKVHSTSENLTELNIQEVQLSLERIMTSPDEEGKFRDL